MAPSYLSPLPSVSSWPPPPWSSLWQTCRSPPWFHRPLLRFHLRLPECYRIPSGEEKEHSLEWGGLERKMLGWRTKKRQLCSSYLTHLYLILLMVKPRFFSSDSEVGWSPCSLRNFLSTGVGFLDAECQCYSPAILACSLRRIISVLGQGNLIYCKVRRSLSLWEKPLAHGSPWFPSLRPTLF